MTFSVVSVSNEQEKVIGTIWADAEQEAHIVAGDLFEPRQDRQVRVRRAEEREIPFLMN